LSVATLLAVAVCFAPAQVQANLITNPSFETPNVGSGSSVQYNTGTQMDATNWPISANGVTLVDSQFGTVASDGDQWLSLEANPGSVNNPGTISQTFNTFIGAKYLLTFDYSALSDNVITPWTMSYGVAGPTESLVISTAGVPSFSLADWATESYEFTATSLTTTLTFRGDQQRNGFYGPAIDNVSVTFVTPEPSSMLLCGLGLVVLAARRRRGNSPR
jgi:hypothetical protein